MWWTLGYKDLRAAAELPGNSAGLRMLRNESWNEQHSIAGWLNTRCCGFGDVLLCVQEVWTFVCCMCVPAHRGNYGSDTQIVQKQAFISESTERPWSTWPVETPGIDFLYITVSTLKKATGSSKRGNSLIPPSVFNFWAPYGSNLSRSRIRYGTLLCCTISHFTVV